MGKGSKNKKKAKAAAAAAAARGVIGPDYIQLISGTLASKQVNIILCGESHEDAIDVSRSGGKTKEGWVATDAVDLMAEMVGKTGGSGGGSGLTKVRVKCGMCKRKDNKLLSLGKAKEWGNTIVDDEIEYIDPGNELALLFVPSKDADGAKGRAYVFEVFIEEEDTDEESDQKIDKSRANLPSDVNVLIDEMVLACDAFQGAKSLSVAAEDIKSKQKKEDGSGIMIFQWTDLDAEARALNHRRLLGEDIATSEHDKLISDRTKKRRDEENLWAWDDWLTEVKAKLEQSQQQGQSDGADNPALHCILEAPIPPWEVELCRDLEHDFELSTAADCIRCLSQDSSESELDAFDPSADGFGSYVDYIYRRLMEGKDHNDTVDLHCIDSRDLGCEHACVAESLHQDWMELLQPEEREKILAPSNHAHHKDGRWLPDWEHNPEEEELDKLRNDGVLNEEEDNDEEDLATNEGTNVDLITYPSFEGFFGQNTDILYYAPHCKVAYGPFLGQCVSSLEKFREFFSHMFLGGTVDSALSILDLSENKRPYLHVRSPIMKCFNMETGEYEWHKRNDEEHDLTFPIFPIKCFLKARGSSPPRTWSSQLFHSLQDDERSDLGDLANAAREWVLNDCENQCMDPKNADDEIGGGEWFLAYLREVHRDIYDDIDHTDATALLHKSSVTGEISFKKHKIGNIAIPSCKDGIGKIMEELAQLSSAGSGGKPVLERSVEVMAKILIDIFMSKLVDFSTVLKIAQVIAKEPSGKVCVVVYMGSVHTRAISDFYCGTLGFKKKTFLGQQNWPMEEARILHLPPEMWNLEQLVKQN